MGGLVGVSGSHPLRGQHQRLGTLLLQLCVNVFLAQGGYKAPNETPAREDDTFESFSHASKISKTPVQELDRRLPSRPSSLLIGDPKQARICLQITAALSPY